MYEILCGCVQSLQSYIENGWKYYYFISGCIIYWISLIFLYKHVLVSLQNLRSKFCVAVLRRCGDMLKMGGKSTISFSGAFFIRFLWFLFMNTFYQAYEIHVQNFVRLGRVVVEICWNWVEILLFHLRVCFLTDFFDVLLCTRSI